MENICIMEESLRLDLINKFTVILDYCGAPLSTNEVLWFEQTYSIVLPQPFKEFLLHFDGGALGKIDVGFSVLPRFKTNQECQLDLYYFLSLREHNKGGEGTIVDDIDTMREWILEDFGLNYDHTKDFIPIAYTDGNSRICIGCSLEYHGKIYIFDAGTDLPEALFGMYIPLAESLEQFICEVIQPCNDKSYTLLNERLKNGWKPNVMQKIYY